MEEERVTSRQVER